MGRNDNFGLADSLEYLEMQLDSYDAATSVAANVKPTDWPLFYLGKQLVNVAGMKIIEVEIPFSFYVFNQANNVFTISIPSQSIAGLPVVIPVGNYTAESLATVLAQRLQAAVLALVPLYPGIFTVTYSGGASVPSTGKFTFTLANGGADEPWSMAFGSQGDNGNFSPRLFLGFNSGVSPSTFVPGTGNVIQAQNVSQVTGPSYLYLNSRRLGSLANLYLPTGASNIGNGTTGPQIAKIPVNVQPGGTIFWQDPDPGKYFDFENVMNLSDLDLYLTLGNSSNQVPLQLNGLSFSVKIGFLINKIVSNNLLGGHVSANRVFQRLTG